MMAVRRRLAVMLRRLSHRIEGPGPSITQIYEWLEQNFSA